MALKPGMVMIAPPSSYIVKNILGSGAFGKVVLCRKKPTEKIVAVKVFEKEDNDCALVERKILQFIKRHGSEKHNIVQWFRSFEFRGSYCLEFEKLDISLAEFILKSGRLSFPTIRPILHQLASGLKFLKTIRLIHGDLKPENIMMVDHASNLKVKIIDFGLAQMSSTVEKGCIIQTSSYRAPEVFLGACLDESVDIWSLGCVALEMFLGYSFFLGYTNYDVVRHIVKTIGTPPTYMLLDGKYTKIFFKLCSVKGSAVWRLKPQVTFSHSNSHERMINRLVDLYQLNPFDISDSTKDKELDFEYFIHLVEHMLDLDPLNRATPEYILGHPFLSMSYLEGVFNTKHVRESVELMKDVLNHPTQRQCYDDEQPSTSSVSSSNSKHTKRKRETRHQDRPPILVENAPELKCKQPSKKRKREDKEEANVQDRLPILVEKAPELKCKQAAKKRKREDEEEANVQDGNNQIAKRQKVTPIAVTVQTTKKPKKRDQEDEIVQLRFGRVFKRQTNASEVTDRELRGPKKKQR